MPINVTCTSTSPAFELQSTQVVSGVLCPDLLFTHRFPLDGLGAALDATHERSDGFNKALVLYA